MFFTIDDYRKIEKWLQQRSIKDSQFEEALVIKGDELVPIIQEGQNRVTNISKLTKALTIKPYNEDKVIELIESRAEDGTRLLSGDIRIWDNQNNILKKYGNTIGVDGSANNIKYKDTNLFSTLEEVEANITDISKFIDNLDRAPEVDDVNEYGFSIRFPKVKREDAFYSLPLRGASTTAAGLLIGEDKAKLNGIEPGVQIKENAYIDSLTIRESEGADAFILSKDNRAIVLEFDKKLSTEDFTSELRRELESLSLRVPELSNEIQSLITRLNTLVDGNTTEAIDTFNEIVKFLENIEDSENLASIIAGIQMETANKVTEEANLRKTADDELMSLIVSLHSVTTFNSSISVLYKGEPETVVFNSSVKFNNEPLNYTLTIDGENAPNGRLTKVYDADWDTKTIVGTFTINDPKVQTTYIRQLYFSSRYPRYSGFIDKEEITESDIFSLIKLSRSAVAAATVIDTINTDSYFWVCFPSNIILKGVTSNGFEVPLNDPIEIQTTNKGLYKCYRSTNKINAGKITFNLS